MAASFCPSAEPASARIKTVVLRVEVGDGLDVTATSEHEDAAKASASEQQLRDAVEQMRVHLGPIGLAPYLDGVIIASQGVRVVASLRLSQAQCERLAELGVRLAPLLLRGGAGELI